MEVITPELVKYGVFGLLFLLLVALIFGGAWIAKRLFGHDGVITKHIERLTVAQTNNFSHIKQISDSLSNGSNRIENTNENIENIKRAGIAYCDALHRACQDNGHAHLLPDIDRIRRELNGGN